MSTDINIIPKYPSPQIQNKTLNKTGPVEVITAVSFVFWMNRTWDLICSNHEHCINKVGFAFFLSVLPEKKN